MTKIAARAGFFALLLSFTSVQAQTLSDIPRDVPIRPDSDITPGALCTQSTTFRYPERIKYCNRDVDSQEKERVFEVYSSRYNLSRYTRHDFKIDHFVPLCMGGSNDPHNLWPQHLTISAQTDRIEELLCLGMAQGKLKQALAVQTILQVKRDLRLAAPTRARLEQAYGIERF